MDIAAPITMMICGALIFWVGQADGGFTRYTFYAYTAGLGLLVFGAVLLAQRLRSAGHKAAPPAEQFARGRQPDGGEAHPEAAAPKYEHQKYRVAGTTFTNGQKSRQAILRHIKFRDPPYDGEVEFLLQPYDYEGEPAIGVYVNGDQIGNIPREQVPALLADWPRIDAITALDVKGGGTSASGETLHYGAEITLRLHAAPTKEEATVL